MQFIYNSPASHPFQTLGSPALHASSHFASAPAPVAVHRLSARDKYLRAVADAQAAREQYLSELEEERVLATLQEQEALYQAEYRQRQLVAAQNNLNRRRIGRAYAFAGRQPSVVPFQTRRYLPARQPRQPAFYIEEPQMEEELDFLSAMFGNQKYSQKPYEQDFIEQSRKREEEESFAEHARKAAFAEQMRRAAIDQAQKTAAIKQAKRAAAIEQARTAAALEQAGKDAALERARKAAAARVAIAEQAQKDSLLLQPKSQAHVQELANKAAEKARRITRTDLRRAAIHNARVRFIVSLEDISDELKAGSQSRNQAQPSTPDTTPTAPTPTATPKPSKTTHPSSALNTIGTLHTRFEFLKRTFAFPGHLEFRDTSPAPDLLYTASNAAVHGYTNELMKLLTLADAVPSDGSELVREARRAFVRAVEKAIDDVEGKVRRVWEGTNKREVGEAATSVSMPISGPEERQLEVGIEIDYVDVPEVAVELGSTPAPLVESESKPAAGVESESTPAVDSKAAPVDSKTTTVDSVEPSQAAKSELAAKVKFGSEIELAESTAEIGSSDEVMVPATQSVTVTGPSEVATSIETPNFESASQGAPSSSAKDSDSDPSPITIEAFVASESSSESIPHTAELNPLVDSTPVEPSSKDAYDIIYPDSPSSGSVPLEREQETQVTDPDADMRSTNGSDDFEVL